MFHRARGVVVLSSIMLVFAGCGENSVPEAAPTPDDGVSLESAKQQPPPPVSHFSGRAVAAGVELTWTASPDVRYGIFRRDARGAEVRLERVEPGPGHASYLDEKPPPDAVFEYWIVPANLWGVQGEASPELTIQVP